MGYSREQKNNSTGARVNPNRSQYLSKEHRCMLLTESGIDPGVAEERGYQTVRNRSELLDFKKYQRRAPALRAPMYSPDGETTSSQLRPNTPRKNKKGKPIKYETPGGREAIIDAHPRVAEEVRSGGGELWITEGMKKADALVSRGCATIGLAGVWMYAVKDTQGRQLKPCWDHVRLEGRTVNVVYDCDVMTKPEVQQALSCIVEALEARGASVKAVYLPDLGDGKTGVDDYLAAGHTVAELRMLSRRYEAADIGEIRLSQDDELRAAIEGAWSAWWSNDWNRVTGTGNGPDWRRGHTARDVEAAAIERAVKSGVVTEDGIYFSFDRRSWSEAAAKSRPAIQKAIDNLEAEGRIKRSEIERSEGRGAGYVLLTPRAILYQYGERESGRESPDSLNNVTSDHFGKGPRAPRLRWSVNRQPARRGLIKGTRKPREFRLPARDSIKRLGPNRGAIVDALDALGGSATLGDLAATLHKARARDVRRRLLPRLEKAGVVEVSGGDVSLSEDWRQALYNERVAGLEVAHYERDHNRHARQREAYYARDKVHASPHWTNHADADGDADELHYLGPQPSPWALYPLLKKHVQTDRGPGVLWQVIAGEARVILDSNPARWTALDYAEIQTEVA